MIMDEVHTLKTLLNPETGDKNYFDFEEDFVEDNVRCIPMIVRFKLDTVGIKLRLAEWSRFSVQERAFLAIIPADNTEEIAAYHLFLNRLVEKHTGQKPTALAVDPAPAWAIPDMIPEILQIKACELGHRISLEEWKRLSHLQRFALLKLCRPGHENRNFPKAMGEFGLL
jgi:hypothetical protein